MNECVNRKCRHRTKHTHTHTLSLSILLSISLSLVLSYSLLFFCNGAPIINMAQPYAAFFILSYLFPPTHNDTIVTRIGLDLSLVLHVKARSGDGTALTEKSL